MKTLAFKAALALPCLLLAAAASADPGKDESGKGRAGYERPNRTYDRSPRAYGDYRERRERRAFKEEYDDGNCKYERKLEKSGEYKEEVKCRSGAPVRSRASGYRYGY